MNDIAQRLRKRMTSHDQHYLPDAMSQEAADEIERLRGELSEIKANYYLQPKPQMQAGQLSNPTLEEPK